MNIVKAKEYFFTSIEPVFGEREAESITRIYFEDQQRLLTGHSDIKFDNQQIQLLQDDVKKIVSGVPIQYVTGNCHFYGFDFNVNPAVLIPRPETEELVHWIIEDHKEPVSKKVLDIGTGSGCIPLTLKKKLNHLEVSGLDISADALETAKTNAEILGVDVKLFRFDILEENDWKKLDYFQVLISNPPYVTRDELKQADQDSISNEPEVAIYVNSIDPLIFYIKIIELALYLKSVELVYFEINEFRYKELVATLENHGLANYELRKDLQGKYRMVKLILN